MSSSRRSRNTIQFEIRPDGVAGDTKLLHRQQAGAPVQPAPSSADFDTVDVITTPTLSKVSPVNGGNSRNNCLLRHVACNR